MKRIIKLTRFLILAALTLCAIFIIGALYYIEYQLPNIEELKTVQLQVPLRIFTNDGKLMATYGEKRRFPIPYENIPKPLIQAVLATEDQRFFQHPGVDLPGLFRAGIKLLLTGKKSEGGSTITMQVARSFYLTRQKTYARKLKEILLAIKIDRGLPKEKILELYLNKVFLGHRAYGVEAAANTYYGKHLNQLTLAEMAMIAGLPKAPSTLNPLTDKEAAKKRRNHVLERMLQERYNDEKAYLQAVEAPMTARYHELDTEMNAQYASELARMQLEEMYGESIFTDGFDVYTTISSRAQQAANNALSKNVLAYDQRHGFRGPIANFGTPQLDKMDEWEKKLNAIEMVNDLEPAAVYEMTKRSVTVMRANGDLVIIPWEGLSWARPYIDNRARGPKPQTASDIVKLGDVIYIEKTASGFQLSQLPKVEAALVALNPNNGAIAALIGGFDYKQSNFDRAIRASRQPGSSFKPFIYSAALDKGFTLATVINDAPIVIENRSNHSLWRPQNDTHQFYGPTRLRDALTLSRNLVSIRLLSLMGVNYAKNYLKQFGFEPSQLPQGLALALGTAEVTPLQMAAGYAVFANGGQHVVPYIISRIINSNKDIIYSAKPLIACQTHCEKVTPLAPRVISSQSAYLITSVLQDVIQNGTAKKAKALNRMDIAGKTGTTQNLVDSWFAGYHSNLVAVTWMGFDQPQSLYEYGADAALPMWMDFMHVVLQNIPEKMPDEPVGIVSVRIDPLTGNRTSASNPAGIFELFMNPFVPKTDTQQPADANTPITNEETVDEEAVY